MRFFVLFCVAALIAGAIFYILEKDRFQVNALQSTTTNKPMPAFSTAGLNYKDLEGEKAVVNFFASWCAPCKIEHPLLIELAEQNIPVYGIAFRDKIVPLQNYLETNGNPYKKYGSDAKGIAGIEWGLKGVPETFVVNESGNIIWHVSGILTAEHIAEIKNIFN